MDKKRLSNAQGEQPGILPSPVDGGDGFTGADNGASLGFDVVEGKKGSVKDQSIWNQRTSYDAINSGSDPDPSNNPAGSDSTDEYATYKRVQTDEGLPQTYRNSEGAGDGGVSGSDEPDSSGGVFGEGGSNQGNPDTQKIGSEMPQTEFTHNDGGGAPRFKHQG